MILLAALSVHGQSAATGFSFPERGGVSVTTAGASGTLQTGYARISHSGTAPSGFATFALRQNNALISEVSIPAANLISSGRIFAEVGGFVNTGLALANSVAEDVDVAFYFTDLNGTQLRSGFLTIPAKGQIARFLNEAPFNAGPNFVGTMTFFTLRPTPDLTIAAMAIRSYINERGEFLMTTLPVAPRDQRGFFSGPNIPHFATGGGWTTDIMLVNPTDAFLAGTISFRNPAGAAMSVETEQGPGARFTYTVAPRSAYRLRTSGAGAVRVGSVQFESSVEGSDIPIGFLTFAYRPAGVTLTMTGVLPPAPASVLRLYVENSGDFNAGLPNSLQTQIAIANSDPVHAARVTLELTTFAGTAAAPPVAVDIPAGGQIARSLSQIPGFETLPTPFQGVLRISSSAGSISAIGLRARWNERHDFLIATVPAVVEDDPYFTTLLRYSDFIFPHFADGGGYSTQFVLFSGWMPGAANGTLQFYTNTGNPFPLVLK